MYDLDVVHKAASIYLNQMEGQASALNDQLLLDYLAPPLFQDMAYKCSICRQERTWKELLGKLLMANRAYTLGSVGSFFLRSPFPLITPRFMRFARSHYLHVLDRPSLWELLRLKNSGSAGSNRSQWIHFLRCSIGVSYSMRSIRATFAILLGTSVLIIDTR